MKVEYVLIVDGERTKNIYKEDVPYFIPSDNDSRDLYLSELIGKILCDCANKNICVSYKLPNEQVYLTAKFPTWEQIYLLKGEISRLKSIIENNNIEI